VCIRVFHAQMHACVYTYTYIYTHLCICIHAWTYKIRIHLCIRTSMGLLVSMYMYTYMDARFILASIYSDTRLDNNLPVHTHSRYVYIHGRVHVCIHINT